MYYLDEMTARAIKKYPHRAIDIVQSFDKKQVQCKRWLCDEIQKTPIKNVDRIYVAGSWYGNILAPLLLELYPDTEIQLHDMDDEVVSVSRNIFFKDVANVRPMLKNCVEQEYKHLLINTSCEHMNPLRCRSGTYVALQSNNYREIEDHINCVDSAEELAEQYDVSEIYYQGVLEFEKYTRYMIIGRSS